jgi:para-nitrobenzyl esterase
MRQATGPRAVRAHLGIRFAEPPVYVGDAAPLGMWAPDCPQPAGAGRTRAPGQDEDCLFLNVWAPEGAEGLPVLVWLYGGSFLFGSASDPATDGAYLAGLGCVVVSAAYRVGQLGYLAHPALTAESDRGSSGNYGLADNLLALRWVRDNIARFGGDPARVTAFGVSAGSASLALLQTSPLAAGAFDQLILQSPGCFRPLAPLADAEAGGLAAYGPDLGAMRAWSPAEVLAQSAALIPKVRGLTSPRLVRPIADGWVVPEDDRVSYRAGRFLPVPTIVGGNRSEGRKLTEAWPIDTVAAYRKLIDADFGDRAAEALTHYPAASDGDVRAALADVFGDTQFSYGARGVARAVSARQPRTWRYLYTADPADHGDEVAGLFAGSTPAGRAMAQAWVDFATTGDPDPGGTATTPTGTTTSSSAMSNAPERTGANPNSTSSTATSPRPTASARLRRRDARISGEQRDGFHRRGRSARFVAFTGGGEHPQRRAAAIDRGRLLALVPGGVQPGDHLRCAVPLGLRLRQLLMRRCRTAAASTENRWAVRTPAVASTSSRWGRSYRSSNASACPSTRLASTRQVPRCAGVRAG